MLDTNKYKTIDTNLSTDTLLTDGVNNTQH
jgi:hypothetical protein